MPLDINAKETIMGISQMLKVLWNVHGLGHASRRGMLLKHLKSLGADIMISEVYQSPFSSKARGVAILFHKNIPFQLSSRSTDPHGRYIIVSGNIHFFPVTLLNVYGPNSVDPHLFLNVFDFLPDLGTTNLIL
ncbi:unnamed protein product [Oncorhynchus mykiss]|uniref:Uncharacterized protein n=1 Tax=Oncorhynchus mykiss TaxID=8022 RepID=A0A060WWY9_ONCMY|nr:unnamed protein product [Oncorhynchus mykiss]